MNHSDAQTIHKAAYVSSTDPSLDSANNVQADKLWIDTTGGNSVIKRRNSGNTAWVSITTPSSTPTKGVSLLASTPTTIPDNNWGKVGFDSEVRDDDNFHSNTTNNSRITIPTGGSGWYSIVVTLNFDINGVGSRFARIMKNNVDVLGIILLSSSSGSYTTRMQVSALAYLAAGDYIEAEAYQNSGGPLNVSNLYNETTFVAVSL